MKKAKFRFILTAGLGFALVAAAPAEGFSAKEWTETGFSAEEAAVAEGTPLTAERGFSPADLAAEAAGGDSFFFNMQTPDGAVCREADIWKTWFCADSKENLNKKLRLWDQAMRRGFDRRYNPPPAVKEAAKAVFAIKTGYRFKGKIWNANGGSGFFFLNPRLFVTAFHNLEALFYEDEIASYEDLVFQDQNGSVREELQVKSVLYVSAELDLAVLDVEGYNGPVLQRASPADPSDLSYLIGHSQKKFEIQAVRGAFPADGSYYGAFPSLFDSHYNLNSVLGLSGGPAVNAEGELEAVVFAAFQYNSYTVLFLTNQVFFSKLFLSSGDSSVGPFVGPFIGWPLEEAKRRMAFDKETLVWEMREGDKKLILPYLLQYFSIENNVAGITNFLFPQEREKFDAALKSGAGLARHILIDELLEGRVNPFVIDMFLKESSAQLWPITHYNLGIAAYENGDFEKACRFWQEAEKAGLPYIQNGAVFIPRPLFFNDTPIHIVLCD